MANGRLASCAGDRTRICAVFADVNDDAWLAMLKSDDGGQTWQIPYQDPDLKYFKPGGTVDMGFQASRNLNVAIHSLSKDLILLIGRRSGLLGSTDGGLTWDTSQWPAILDGSFHGDSMCLAVDDSDSTRNTVLAGGDGGAFHSTGFGRSWNTDYNRTLTTLMFDQHVLSSAPALSSSEAFPGLVVGAFQDNGKAYLSGDGEPWRELGHVGDGQRALFVTGDVVMNGGNDDVDLKWARWNGSTFVDGGVLEPIGIPPNMTFMPFMARIPYPTRKESSGALMVALAGDNQPTGNVWGLYDRGQGHSPESTRFFWQLIATVPGQTSAIASIDGHVIVVAAYSAGAPHLHLVDCATGVQVEMQLPGGLPSGAGPRWLTLVDGATAFVLIGNKLLRTTDMISWNTIPSTPASLNVNVIAVDRGSDPPRLLLAGSDGVWSSRDAGATWQPTQGQPAHPQSNHLEAIAYPDGTRVAHMGTWNWGLWRTALN
jgi:hypothetical protein